MCGGGFVVRGGGGDAVGRQSCLALMFKQWQNGWVGGGQQEG